MNEKPIYKNWWFWVIAIFVVSVIYNLIVQLEQQVVPSKPSPQVSEKLKIISSAEHLSNAKKSIEMKNFVAAKTNLDAITKDSPEFSEATILLNQVNEDQKRQALENKITSDDNTLKETETKINNLRIKLKKYYATADDVKDLIQDVTLLTIAENAYKIGKSDAEKRLHSKAATLLPKAQQTLREAYASSVEEIFMKTGINASVKAVGNGKKTLRITFALMSQPLVYKFQNEIKIDEQARDVGFSKLVYTNGFESSLGSTWTVNLK